MAKADELIRASGNHLMQSSSIRQSPAGMSNVVGSIGLKNPKDGLVRSKLVFLVPIDEVMRDPNQPRSEANRGFKDEEIASLADSLRELGQMNPIEVTWSNDDKKWLITSGERRYRAAKLLGWTAIECKIDEEHRTEADRRIRQLVENSQREANEPLEQVRSFRELHEKFGLAYNEIARKVGLKSHSSVSQLISLLTLPDAIQEKVKSHELPAVAAYHVSKISDPAEQAKVVDRIIAEDMSRQDAIALVAEVKAEEPKPKASRKGRGATKAKPKATPRNPDSYTLKSDSGIKVVATYRKGFDATALVEALRDVVAKAEAMLPASGE